MGRAEALAGTFTAQGVAQLSAEVILREKLRKLWDAVSHRFRFPLDLERGQARQARHGTLENP